MSPTSLAPKNARHTRIIPSWRSGQLCLEINERFALSLSRRRAALMTGHRDIMEGCNSLRTRACPHAITYLRSHLFYSVFCLSPLILTSIILCTLMFAGSLPECTPQQVSSTPSDDNISCHTALHLHACAWSINSGLRFRNERELTRLLLLRKSL